MISHRNGRTSTSPFPFRNTRTAAQRRGATDSGTAPSSPSPRRGEGAGGEAPWAVLCCLLLALIACGCNRQPAQTQANSKLKVVTTIYPLADWVRQMYGDAVDVTCLLKPGMSPHTYEPTPEDMVTVSQADVFLSVGLGLEEWIEKIAQAAGSGHVQSHAIGEETFAPGGQGSHDMLIGDNPHVWMDPVLAILMCRQIARDLEQARPGLGSASASRIAAYEAQLQALGKECEAAFPDKKGKGVVTFHNAYTYMLKRCGLTQAAVIEEFPGKEPSAAYLEDLVKTMRKINQHIIFAEPQLSDKAARVIAQEIDGRVEIMDDTGGENVPERDTYVKMIRYNLAKLRDAL